METPALDNVEKALDNAYASLEAYEEELAHRAEQLLAADFDASTVASIEMLSPELGLEWNRAVDVAKRVGTAAGSAAKTVGGAAVDAGAWAGRNLLSLSVAGAKLLGKQIQTAGNELLIFCDKTGRREVERLNMELESISGTPKQKAFTDKGLASAFSIEGRTVSDFAGQVARLDDFAKAVVDDYIPKVMARDKQVWSIMEQTGFLKKPDRANGAETVEKVMQKILSGPTSFVDALPERGLAKFPGNRHLFRVAADSDFEISARATDALTGKMVKAFTSLHVELAGPGAARTSTSNPANAVMETLEPHELQRAVRDLEDLTKIMNVLAKAYKTDNGKRLYSKLQSALLSGQGLQTVRHLGDNGKVLDKTQDTVLDKVDASRLRLIQAYLSHSQFQTARLMLNLSYLSVSMWKSQVAYIKKSLKQYK